MIHLLKRTNPLSIRIGLTVLICLAPWMVWSSSTSLFYFSTYVPAEFLKEPFWRAKPKLIERVRNERAILVSVRRRDADREADGNLMIVSGGGQVKAPLNDVYKIASDFSLMPKMSSHVHEARFDRERSRLFVHSSAYGFHARMLMNIKLIEDKNQKTIHFQIIKGVCDGMIGVVQFQEVDSATSEISIFAFYPYKKLGFPAFFLQFGLEIALQKMASSIREFVEAEYKKSLVSMPQ